MAMALALMLGAGAGWAQETAQGPAPTGTVTVLGFEFRGDRTPFDFATGTDSGALWCTGAVDTAHARLRLPHGATLREFRVWGADSSAGNDLRVGLIQSCLPNLLPASGPVNTELAVVLSTGTPGSFAQTLVLQPDLVVDNRDCTYWVRVRFAAACAGGSQLAIRKARVRYQR